MPDLREWAGIAAGVLAFVPCPIYVHGMVGGSTRPDRITWWVLAFVSGVISVSYFGAGARETLWLPIGYTASFLIVAVMSLRYGDGPVRLHTLDRVCLLAAILAAATWYFLSSPFSALLIGICTEFVGLIPTIAKAHSRPWSENRTAWVLTTIASLLNLLALRSWSIGLATYPIYTLATNILVVVLLLRPASPDDDLARVRP